jgi:hypothetical protein
MKVIVLGKKLQGLFDIRTWTGMFVFVKPSVLVCGSWSVITASHFYSSLGIKEVSNFSA